MSYLLDTNHCSYIINGDSQIIAFLGLMRYAYPSELVCDRLPECKRSQTEPRPERVTLHRLKDKALRVWLLSHQTGTSNSK